MKPENQNFFERVYVVAKQIPFGKVTSYGAIARALGTGRSARMVGWAMNASHTMPDVPAHRVVNRNGLLTGKHHFDGTNLMLHAFVLFVSLHCILCRSHVWMEQCCMHKNQV